MLHEAWDRIKKTWARAKNVWTSLGTLVIFKDRVELDDYICTKIIPEVNGKGLSYTGKSGIDLYSNRDLVRPEARCTPVGSTGRYMAILRSDSFLDWDDDFRSQHSYHYQWSLHLEQAPSALQTLYRALNFIDSGVYVKRNFCQS